MSGVTKIIIALVFLAGCETPEEAGDCKKLIVQVCELCAVSRTYDDTVCECIVGGSISRPQDYFNNARQAEIFCQNQKNQVKSEFLSPETAAECAQDYALINKYKGDACATLGYHESYDTGRW